SRDDAVAEARRRFGDLARYRRDLVRMASRRRLRSRVRGALETAASSVLFALRGVRRAPGFALAVVVTLSLGIGANAATFRVVDRLFLSPPPHIERPGEVRRLHQVFDPDEGEEITFDMFSYVDVTALRASGLPV